MSLIEGGRKEQELPHLGLSWTFPLQTFHFPIFPIFPLCFTLIFLSMKVSSLEICCSMRYAIEALVELLDLGVSHQGVHHGPHIQSPVHSSPPGYQIKATWIWWIPGGYLVDTWWIWELHKILSWHVLSLDIFVPKLPVLLWFPFLPRQLISPWNSQNLGNAWRAMPLSDS